ncbi:hypothetical protein CBW53_16060 [Yersinia frederiksenii]|nr:hypothetical protein CBW53_16060 [Yersinia frederiksenii]
MDTTTSRAEFEAWLKSKMPTTYKLAFEDSKEDELTNLAKASVLDMRIGWQASRESLVVERISSADVPSDIVYQLGGSGLSHDEAICEGYSAGFNAALRTAGIRIKGESE